MPHPRPLPQSEVREFFQTSPCWALLRAELLNRLQESRRLASALESEVEIRRAQGACRELEAILRGELEAGVLAECQPEI